MVSLDPSLNAEVILILKKKPRTHIGEKHIQRREIQRKDRVTRGNRDICTEDLPGRNKHLQKGQTESTRAGIFSFPSLLSPIRQATDPFIIF